MEMLETRQQRRNVVSGLQVQFNVLGSDLPRTICGLRARLMALPCEEYRKLIRFRAIWPDNRLTA